MTSPRPSPWKGGRPSASSLFYGFIGTKAISVIFEDMHLIPVAPLPPLQGEGRGEVNGVKVHQSRSNGMIPINQLLL